jgi:hypothetical protein
MNQMPEDREKDVEVEPIGIVISRGTRAETTPRVLAYVWGLAEDPAPEPPDARAA